MRELLQNARDAIVARKELENGFEGIIRISVIDEGTGPPTLEVSDNGVGMSERVMMGPLLDFGGSFWGSDLLAEEFPGLQSSKFDSVGRFGIGFYSVFMVSAGVTVRSRRYDRGLETACSMSFPKGLTLRPIIKIGTPENFGGSNSTVVRCVLKPIHKPIATRILKTGAAGSPDLEIGFMEFAARLACAVDVAVEVKINGGHWISTHSAITNIIRNPDATTEWLKGIALTKYRPLAPGAESIEDAANRLRPIVVNGVIAGLASVNLGPDTQASGLTTIGGLQSGGYTGLGGARSYHGFLESRPTSAKRDAGARVADDQVMATWGAQQLDLLRNQQLSIPQRIAVGHYLSDLNIDPSELLLSLFVHGNQTALLTLDQTLDVMKSVPIAIFKFSAMEHTELYIQQGQYQQYPTYRPTGNSAILSLALDGNVPKNYNSFIGCLYRRAQQHGKKLRFELMKGAAGQNAIGQITDVLLVILDQA